MPVMNATHVALLRGINVGRAKRVAMADLRALVTELGYGDVRTLLNSGNVVFSAPGVATESASNRIEKTLSERLGVSTQVTVLASAELGVAVNDNPLLDIADNPSRLLVAVPADPEALPLLQPLLKQEWAAEAVALGKRVAYLWCPAGVLACRLLEAVEKILNGAVTSRNWKTILKLHALAQDGS